MYGSIVKFCSTILSDAADACRHILSALLLLSGFNVCIALGALLSGVILNGIEQGLSSFHTVMSFEGCGLVRPLPDMIATLNWCTLGAMLIFTAYSITGYLTSAAHRSAAPARIIKFPGNAGLRPETQDKQVANG